jgi:CBS domain containing-hemolysin-like protein
VALLLTFVLFALGVSFLCSLLEASLLSARISNLAEQSAQGSRGAALLLRLKQTRIDDAISAILILNTLANTLGATMAGAQAAHVFGSAWIGVFSGVLTFLILVFSEIIPKTLGAVYARSLSGFVGYVLTALTRVMAPVLVLSRGLTRLLARDSSQPYSRAELAAVIDTASSDGTLTDDERTFFSNLLRFDNVRVEDVMTPRTVMFMMRVDDTVGDLLGERRAQPFSRIPLYREHRDEVVGYVLHRDVLAAAARGCDRSRRLDTFLRKIWFVPEMVTVGAALQKFLSRSEPIAMVADERGGVAGLLTLEDLTETILGTEIVDESDQVVDLRQAAAEYRDRRLERLRRERDLDSSVSPAE